MDKDTLTLIGNIAICLSSPIIAILFGLAGRSILRAKGYSGWVGFILGAVFGILGLIIAFVLPQKSIFQTAPRISTTPSESYSSSSSSTYDDDDDNYDPRNDWNSLSATDQGNLMRDMERRENAAEERDEFIRGLFGG